MRRRSNTQGIRRSGCNACKIRHKKCDEGKPRCRNCIRRKLPCDQPDVFRTAILTVTKSTRPKTTTYVESEEGSVLDADDGPNMLRETTVATDPPSSPATPGSASSESSIEEMSSPCTTLSIQPDASSMERYLLYHYTFRMSSLLINVDSPSNPLRSVLLPRAVVSPVLNDALYAVAALHISVGKDNPKFRTASLAYYDKALSAFYSRIMTLPEWPNRSDLEVLLLTAVFLCKYEIISGGVSNWRSHLQGVKEMLEAFQRRYLLSAPETTSYVQSFIQYHSSVATITQSDAYASPQTSDPGSVDEFELELTAPIDPYMGVSARYISMLRTAAEAVMLDPNLPSNVSTMMSNAVNIFQALPSRTPYPATLESNYDLDQMTMTYVHHIAEAYRNALVAYLHTILDRIDGYETSMEVKLQAVGMRTLLGITKDDALSACVTEMQCVPDDQSCSVGLVPLLFIVASETRNLEEYNIGTTRLGKVFQKACLGNIVPALELLHKTKQTQAGDWREILRAYRWDLIVV